MTKNLQKAIMIRSRLLNKYSEGKTETSCCAYKKQITLCVKLLKKWKDICNDFGVKKVTDNKLFKRTVAPNFSW